MGRKAAPFLMSNLEIESKAYLRQRLEPMPGDPDYLHLRDLLRGLSSHQDSEALTVLDFGAGGSPYRSLFPNADYRRADFGEMSDLDYVIWNDSRVEEEDET